MKDAAKTRLVSALAREFLNQAARNGVPPNSITTVTDERLGITVVVIGPETPMEAVERCIESNRRRVYSDEQK
jgi:hypothetical protein